MNRYLTLGAVMIALVFLAGSYSPDLAQGQAAQNNNSPLKSTGQEAEQMIALAPHALLNTYFRHSNSLVYAGAGFATIDPPATVICPSTCTIGVEQNVQLIGVTQNNRWAVCTAVDGNFIGTPACPFLGIVPIGTYGTGSFAQQAAGIPAGTHTVQTYLYSDFGAQRSIYNLIYRIYGQ